MHVGQLRAAGSQDGQVQSSLPVNPLCQSFFKKRKDYSVAAAAAQLSGSKSGVPAKHVAKRCTGAESQEERGSFNGAAGIIEKPCRVKQTAPRNENARRGEACRGRPVAQRLAVYAEISRHLADCERAVRVRETIGQHGLDGACYQSTQCGKRLGSSSRGSGLKKDTAKHSADIVNAPKYDLVGSSTDECRDRFHVLRGEVAGHEHRESGEVSANRSNQCVCAALDDVAVD